MKKQTLDTIYSDLKTIEKEIKKATLNQDKIVLLQLTAYNIWHYLEDLKKKK